MRTSESTINIFPALSAAQGEMSNPPKNADNPFFKSAYADHPSILNMARPVLAKHGLALAQSYGEAGLTTVLTHDSGEWMMTDPLPIKAEKVTAQGIGSAITYARRYAACALLNIAGEDDDGNAASEAPKQEQKPASQPAAKPSPAPEVTHDTDETKKRAQLNDMRVWLLEMSDGDLDMFADLLEMNTEFTNAKGELVHGRRDLKKLSDKQVPVIHRKLKDEYARFKEPAPDMDAPLDDEPPLEDM